MTNKALFFFSLLIINTSYQTALAVGSLTAHELVGNCQFYADTPESIDAVLCVRYIQGFIDGAVATDESVMTNVAAEYENEETFAERAIRTRVKNRLDNHSPTYYADFCVGGQTPLHEVVENVIVKLSDLTILNKYTLGRTVVYQTLRDEYPCAE